MTFLLLFVKIKISIYVERNVVMKKLLALFMAAVMLFSLAVSVGAVDIDPVEQFVEVNFSDSTDYYNPNNTVYVCLSLENITLPEGDGLSAVELELYYDVEMVEPAFVPSLDGDGDKSNFEALLINNPNDAWECFGYIDADFGKVGLGLADINATNLVAEDGMLYLKMPFKVKSTARVKDIVFSLESFAAYNGAITKSCVLDTMEIAVQYALQPDTLIKLPDEAVKLDIAGYKHAVNNVIYYAETEITVGDYVARYMTPAAGQDKMQSFAVIIANAKGKIINIDLGSGSKADMVIPEGGYLIGVHADNAASLDAFSDKLAVGSTITLYNVNLEATGRGSTPNALTDAGFTVARFALKDDADAYFNADEMVVYVYEDNITLSQFKDMFECSISVTDAKGNAVPDSELASTGMIIDHETGVTVVVVGDCNGDGIVDQFDYLMLKRSILLDYQLTPAGYKAVCFVDTYPTPFDYLIVKRYCFGLLDMSQFKPAV